MNKTQLVDALAARIGDRRTAATAVDGLLDTIVDTVGAGESVSITGFGVFESRARAARVARNPRTGEAVEVPATTVPSFRAGAGFRTKVGGGGAPALRSTPARRAAVPTTDPAPAKRPATTKSAKSAKSEAKAAKAPKAKAKAKATDGDKGKPAKGKK